MADLGAIIEKVMRSRLSTTVLGFSVFAGFKIFTDEYNGQFSYHLSAVASYLLAMGIDHYSTLPGIHLMNQNLQGRYSISEGNPVLGERPTLHRYFRRSLVKDGIGMLLGTMVPPLSFAYMAMAPLVYINNRRVVSTLEMELSRPK